MPGPRHVLPARARSGPFAPADVPELSEWQLAGASYQRLARGAYAEAGLEVTHAVRMLGFAAVLGAGVVWAGRSAATAHGSALADPGDRVEVVCERRLARRAHLEPHRWALRDDEVVATPLGPATSPLRTAQDLARGSGLPGARRDAAVVAVDALLRASGLLAADLRAAAAPSGRGALLAREVLPLVADGVDSPRETLLRLLVVDAGLPVPQTQVRVVGPGGLVIARLDLGWPEQRVGLEYDGRVHEERAQRSRDLARHNALRAAGWRVLQVDDRGYRQPGSWLPGLRRLLATAPS